MKFQIIVRAEVVDADDWGGDTYTIFVRLSCNAPSELIAKNLARKVFKKLHPNEKTRISSKTHSINEVTARVTRKKCRPVRRAKVLSAHSATGAGNSVLMGMQSKGGSNEDLNWSRVNTRNIVLS